MLSKTLLAAGVAGLAFVGYCVYFDRKRRSDPDYKQKVRERRLKRRQEKASKSNVGGGEMPDPHDQQAMQAYFLREVQAGEELLAGGQLEEGVEHLANAVAVCGQPRQLLAVLQQSLAPHIFQMLLQRVTAVPPVLSQDVSGVIEEDELE